MSKYIELEAIHLKVPSSQHASLSANLERLGMRPVASSDVSSTYLVARNNACISILQESNSKLSYPVCTSIVFRTRSVSKLEDLAPTESTAVYISANHSYRKLQPAGLPFAVVFHESSINGDDTSTTILDSLFRPITLRYPKDLLIDDFIPSAVDHVALAVNRGDLDKSIAWFEQHLRLTRQLVDGEDLEQGLLLAQAGQGMRMKSLRMEDFYIVIVEPVQGLVGQVHDYVEHHGPGLQHVALLTTDIVASVDRFRALSTHLQLTEAKKAASELLLAKAARRPDFLEKILERRDRGLMITGSMPERSTDLSKMRMLTQVFTQPVNDDSEMFFELIERNNYDGFAPANIGQLFDSLRSDLNVLFVDEQLGQDHFDKWAEELHNTTGLVIRSLSLGLVNETSLVAYLKSTQIQFDVIVSSFVPITEDVLHTCSGDGVKKQQLRLVHAQGSGHNHIDKDACRARRVAVCNNVDWSGQEVAEHTIFVLGALALDLRSATARMEQGLWDRDVVKRSVEGSNLLVIGLGNIGRRVLLFAEALGMRVMIYDPPAGYDSDLHLLLSEADFVSVHVPLSPETTALISYAEFEKMKSTAYIINTARGGVVNEDALLEALDSGKIAGAALDVFKEEPLESSSRFRTHPKVIATPHTAGLTLQSQARAAKHITDNLLRLLKSEHLHNRLLNSPEREQLSHASLERGGSSLVTGLSWDKDDHNTSRISSPGSDDSSRPTPLSSATSVTDETVENFVVPKAYAHLATMRDIFDMIKVLPSEVEVYNLAAGMVEISPSTVLRRLAAEVVVETTTDNSSIPIVHMYRERLGDLVYREGIVKLCREHYKAPLDCTDEMVLATSGVSGAISSIMCAWRTLSRGAQNKFKLGLFSPYYIYHAEIAQALFGEHGFEQATIPLKPDGRHDISVLDQVLSNTPLDCIITTNPGNPSGRAMTLEERDAWLEIITKYPGTWFVFDEVYADMVYEGEFVSFQAPYPENLFVTRGFSKTLAIGAWRLAYVLSHPNRRQDLAREHDRMFLCANWTQLALGRYLKTETDDYVDFLDKWRKRLIHNKRVISDAFLRRFGWPTRQCEGSMYLLIDHNERGGDWAAFAKVLNTCKIATAPGSIFAAEHGSLRIQLAFYEEKADAVAQRILLS